MALKRFIALLFTLLGLIQPSYQQAWKNNNIVWGQAQQENYLPPLSNQPSGENLGLGSLIGYNFQQQQQQQQQLQQHQQQHQQQQHQQQQHQQQHQQQQHQQQHQQQQQQQQHQQQQQQQQHQQQQQQQQQLQQHQQQYHQQQQQQQSNEQNEGKTFLIHNAPSFFYPNPSPVEIPAQAPKPINFAPSTGPQPAAAASAPSPQPVLVDKAQPSQSGPYDIKHETITSNGQKLVENLLGGVPYNCAEKPTGHFRDAHFCDVFHACVFGQQQKSYACPYVGEAQYFDDVTRKCEFVRSNPEACASNAFFH